MQNVLCRFKWQTSAPKSPGRQRPTCAFMLAPSMYTWPPCSWTMRQMRRISSSNTPCVEVVGTMSGAISLDCAFAFASRSATSTLPFSSVFTTTILNPAIAAEAGLVPCPRWGVGHTVRRDSPRARWGDEPAVARRPPARLEPLPDDEQARVFALRARVRLQRDPGEAGDL